MKKFYYLFLALLIVNTSVVMAQEQPIAEVAEPIYLEAEALAAINVTSITGPATLTAGQGGLFTANPAISASQGVYIWEITSVLGYNREPMQAGQTISIGFDVSDIYTISCYILATDGSTGKTASRKVKVMQAP